MKKLHLFFKVLLIGFLLYSCGDDTVNITPEEPLSSNSNINQKEAIVIAQQFIKAQGLLASETRAEALSLTVVYTDVDGAAVRSSASGDPSYYVINIGSDGFVIVSGSRVTLPVLGYSKEGAFDPKNIPANMISILSDYSREIAFARESNMQADEVIVLARRSYLDGSLTRATTESVAPLLGAIKWNQSPYYNAYCPTGTPVGCVATATSQIMRYWEYPAKGKGTYSYNSTYGTLSFDYNYTLNWSNMPKARLTGPNQDVAKLCYGVAVGIKMNFSPSGSGAWQEDVPRLLMEHYSYPNTMKNLYRSSYTDEQWAAILKKELSEGRPVQYAGYGGGGGHSFVCDGYTSNGYFHFNWGWGGMSDGYFLLNALNPGSLGTGGGSGGFNSRQSIITGIQSPNGNSVDEYCTSKGNYAKATFIQNVSVGDINNTTQGNTGGYNYFATPALKIKSGDEMSISLTPGFASMVYKEYWRVWIDYNGDKNFDDGEKVAEGITTTAAPFVASFTVPAGLEGKNTRMRVSMKWGGYPSACETFDHGEVEDYVVTIGSGTELKYCESKGLYARSTFIQRVAIGGMTNTTQSNGGYAYFPDKKVITTAGSSLSYTLTPGFLYQTYPEYWSVWIDYNRNGAFDANERVIQQTSYYAVSGSFVTPASLAKGLYRVRVAMKWGSYSTPCEVFDHGEVEDYNLEIR